MRLLAIATFFLTSLKVFASTPVAINSSQATSIEKYDVFIVHFNVTPISPYTNVFDEQEVNIVGTFTSPTGKTFNTSGYYYQYYNLTCNGKVEKSSRDWTKNEWRLAFSPNEPGNWTYSITVNDSYGTSVVGSSFTCINNNQDGFIKRANTRYLKYDSGKTFIPVGINVSDYEIPGKETGFCQYKDYLDKLKDNNANFIRIWIDRPRSPMCIGGYDKSTSTFFYDQFNQKTSSELDWLMNYTKERGITVQIVFEEGESFVVPSQWESENPFNSNKMGTLTSPYQYFTDDEAIKITKSKARYVMSRWGAYSNFMALEIFNEIDIFENSYFTKPNNFALQALNWSKNIKEYINTIDPYKHLITMSTAGTPNFLWDYYMDFLTPHAYRQPQVNIHEEFGFGDGYIGGKNAYNAIFKPYMIGEYGWDEGTYPHSSSQHDPNGFMLHSDYWTSLVSGNMGITTAFWTKIYIDPQNLYTHLKPIASYTSHINKLSDNIIVSDNKGANDITTNHRHYFLKDNTTESIYGWVQDVNFSFYKLSLNNHKNYLYDKMAWDKPTIDNTPIKFNVNIWAGNTGFYSIKWFNCETGAIYSNEIIKTSNGLLTLTMPQALRSSTYGDAAYIVSYVCSATPSFTLNNSNSLDFIPIDYTTPIIVNAKNSTGESKYFLSVVKVDQSKNSIGTEFAQWFNGEAGDNIDIREFVKSKSGLAYISAGNYKVKIATESNSAGGCTSWEESSKYFTLNCNATSSFTINGSNESDFIAIYNTEPINVDARSCNGENKYFVSFTKVNQSKVSISPEYSQWYNGEAGIIDMKALLKAKLGLSQIPNGYYKIKIAVENTSINGCTGWVESSKYISINCTAIHSFTLNGSSSTDFIPLYYTTPLILDGSESSGESRYYVGVRQVNENKENVGPLIDQWFNGVAGITDVKAFIYNKTGLNLTPSGYFKIIFGVENTYTGGCTSLSTSSKFVSITCNATSSFTINESTLSTDFINTDYNAPVILNASNSSGLSTFFLSIQQTDQYKNTNGAVYSQWFTPTNIRRIDINAYVASITGIATLPLGYYKVKVAVQNTSQGGCTQWNESSKYIHVSCPQSMDVSFGINNNNPASNLSISYIDRENGTNIIMNTHTLGETDFNITIEELNSMGQLVDGKIWGENIWNNGKTPKRFDVNGYLQRLGKQNSWPVTNPSNKYKITLRTKNINLFYPCTYEYQTLVSYCYGCRIGYIDDSFQNNIKEGLNTSHIEAYPNPFEKEISIRLHLPVKGNITIIVYNLLGEEVKKIVDKEYLEEGIYNYNIGTHHLSTGTYIVKLFSDEISQTVKILKH